MLCLRPLTEDIRVLGLRAVIRGANFPSVLADDGQWQLRALLYVPAAVRKTVFAWISEVAHMYPAC